jgi:hypothetical protein
MDHTITSSRCIDLSLFDVSASSVHLYCSQAKSEASSKEDDCLTCLFLGIPHAMSREVSMTKIKMSAAAITHMGLLQDLLSFFSPYLAAIDSFTMIHENDGSTSTKYCSPQHNKLGIIAFKDHVRASSTSINHVSSCRLELVGFHVILPDCLQQHPLPFIRVCLPHIFDSNYLIACCQGYGSGSGYASAVSRSFLYHRFQ